MARHRRGSRRRGFVAIPFTSSTALSTLADDTVLATGAVTNFGEDIYVISADLEYTMRGNTANENPISVGVSHSDLSVTEVLEALKADLSSPDDIIARERARRPVRRVGNFSGPDVNQRLNDGKPIRQKIKFSIGNGFDLDLWFWNRSGGALQTGTVIEVDGTIYGRWQR